MVPSSSRALVGSILMLTGSSCSEGSREGGPALDTARRDLRSQKQMRLGLQPASSWGSAWPAAGEELSGVRVKGGSYQCEYGQHDQPAVRRKMGLIVHDTDGAESCTA